MAWSGVNDGSGVNSVKSELVEYLHCDPCKYDGNVNEARGFCQQCGEHLCNVCIQYHRKLQITRTHVINKIDNLPKMGLAQKQELLSPVIYCDDHRTNEVTYFCSNHKGAYCSMCKATRHAACESKNINDFVKSENVSKLPAVISSLEEYVREFENEAAVYSTHMSKAKFSVAACKEDIGKTKQEVLEIFQQVEADVEEVDMTNREFCGRVEKDVKLCNDICSHLTSSLISFRDVQESLSPKAKFVTLLKADKLLAECNILQNKLSVDKIGHSMVTCSFTIRGDLQRILKKGILGKVVTTELGMSEEEHSMSQESEKMEKIEQRSRTESCWSDAVKREQPPPAVAVNATKLEEYKFSINHSTSIQSMPGNNKTMLTAYTETGTKTKVPLAPIAPLKKCQSVLPVVKPFTGYDLGAKAVLSKYVDHIETPIESDCKFLCEYLKLDAPEQESNEPQKMDFVHMKLKKFGKSRVRRSEDSKVCDITGLAVFPNHLMVACDHANGNIILLNPNFQVVDVCKTKVRPWDVAVINEDEGIATIPNEKILQFFSISEGKLVLMKEMNTRCKSYGIDIFHDHMFLTQHNNPGDAKVEVRRMDGKVIRQILPEDGSRQCKWSAPSYISVNKVFKDTCIYISDGHQKSVSCVNLNKGSFGHVQSQALSRWPKGLAVDCNGNCMICLRFGNELKLIYYHTFTILSKDVSLNGKKMKNFLDSVDHPQVLCMDWSKKIMVIGVADSDEIFIAQFQ